MTTPLARIRLLLASACAALAAIALAAPTASAGPLVASADCEEEALSRPFLPWLDLAQYQFAPDGGFEAGGEGWSLDGATAVSGNESHYLHSASDSASLSMPGASSATSPTVCVGIEHPTIRFVAKRSSGLPASMAVKVRFEDAVGRVHSAPIGTVVGTSAWQPSAPMPIVANLLPLLPGEYTPVRFRFTTLNGTMRIDDLYIDPHRKG
jgi:hypothetical protein